MPPTHRFVLVVFAFLALLAHPAAAQPAPSSAGAVRGVRAGSALRVDVGPTVDGSLSEGAWANAMPFGDFVQYEPYEGTPATERTEVRILTDADALYVGAWMFDQEASGIIVGERRRDTNLSDSDAFVIVLDTYFDRQNGFVFGTNPGAIEYDGQVRGEAGPNTSWDGSWTVATSQDAAGWYVEMRIPFSTLRYGSGPDQVWGVNLTRYIRRKNEQVVWSPVPRQYGFYRLTEAGQLTDVQPPPRRVTTVTPYVLGAASRVPRIDPDVDYPREIGADAKIGITPGLALDLTVNTDFAQVEADDQQVDLTRFNLFFPEKRPFFLENADLFAVGLDFLPGRTSGRTALFHSRRIGVQSGDQVPIDWGSRMSGRAPLGMDVGMLYMRTGGLTGLQDPTEWSVARVARELGNRSRVGAIFTSRSSLGSSDFGRTYGTDARIGLGERWTFTTMAGLTEEPGVSDSRHLLSGVGEFLSRNWYVRVYHDRVGWNFDPQMGYIPYNGFTESALRVERIVRPAARSWWREFRIHVRRTWSYDLNGFKELEFRHIHANLSFEDGSQLSPALQWIEEGLRVPFTISGAGITVPAGSYKGWNSYGNFRTNPSAPLSFNGRWDLGRYLSGNRWGGQLGVAYRYGDVITSSVSVSHNRIRLPEGAFNTTLTRVSLRYGFTPNIFAQGIVQYSDQSGVWSGNVRFGWLDTAGTGLFVVYNERLEMDATGVRGLWQHDPIDPPERTFAIKFTRQFDLSEMMDF
jgi:hypothetical protein